MAAQIVRTGFTVPYTPKKSGASKTSSKSTGPTAEVVEAALVRAGFSCEVCDHMLGDRRGIDFSVHHRRPRQMGGTHWEGINLLSNLGIVCGSGTTGCHQDIESNRALAVASGWLVPSVTDPAKIPLLLHRERWTYLTNDGHYSDNPPAVQS